MKTLFDKIWDQHSVYHDPTFNHDILYIDLHLIHEVTSPYAFEQLKTMNRPVRQLSNTLATIDHIIPTRRHADQSLAFRNEADKRSIESFKENCRDHSINCYDDDHDKQGIVHVVAPENGKILPGMTVVCGDSHTSTHGAFGAFAFGIGSTDVFHVLATQCLVRSKPKTLGIRIDGVLQKHVSAKDLILYIISQISNKGGTGHVIEYYGEAISALSMEERMTICNMSIEAGAVAGIIAPDESTLSYLKERMSDDDFERLHQSWDQYVTDDEHLFDQLHVFNAKDIKPMITYGTNPETAISIDSTIPKSADQSDLEYMNFNQEQSMEHVPIDYAFIGSCTNSRIQDLRVAAKLLKNQQIANNVTLIIVPGSKQVKQQAEFEGLDKIFVSSGAEWREPGCSLCLGMNGDVVPPGKLCMSTSNRNFKGRQGIDSRTILASPYMVALAALNGKITKPGSIHNED